jgi:L-amino acid N-acyltransferase YncA
LEERFEIRPAQDGDAQELTLLLNEIIARGRTTALEEPFAVDTLASTMLFGNDVIGCFVAVDRATGKLLGFQSLLKYHGVGDGIADIATFAHIGLTRKGLGSALFLATRTTARQNGVKVINATIRADNIGGLAFYARVGFVDHDIQRAVPLHDGTPVDRISKLYVLSQRAGD